MVFAIVVGIFGVPTLTVAAVYLFGSAVAGNHAEMRNEDASQTLDTPAVVTAARTACAKLDDDLALLPTAAPGMSRDLVAERVVAENAAITAFVATLSAVGDDALAGDAPALMYVNDWERLVTARNGYAADVTAGGPARLRLPPDEYGIEITDRMRDAAPWCPVPDRLASPPAFGD